MMLLFETLLTAQRIIPIKLIVRNATSTAAVTGEYQQAEVSARGYDYATLAD